MLHIVNGTYSVAQKKKSINCLRVVDTCLLSCFFFFQAEDGIRDLTVTGVQTCALPISWLRDGGSVLSAAKPATEASVLLRSADGAPLLGQQRVGHGRLLSLPGDWDIPPHAALRDAQLPRSLLLALQPPSPPRVGDATDHAPRQTALPAATPPLREPTAWLLLAVVLLFAVERWMASSARRRVAA